MTKFYIDISGNYLGGFDGNTGKIPAGAIEVSTPPKDGRAIWDGSSWVDPVLSDKEKVLNAEVKNGILIADKVEAIWQFLFEAKPDASTAIQAIRDQVKGK